MAFEPMHRAGADLDDVNEKLRREVVKPLEQHGLKLVSELPGMSEGERVKWLFWNLHENLDSVRKFEPTLLGQVMSTQLTVSDGQSMWTEKCGIEKRIELRCKWHLLLSYSTFQNEETYEIGEGWVNLFIGDKPPAHPTLQKNQKGYLDSDSNLYPNQLFLNGWITDDMWQEIKPQLYTPNPALRADIVLLDNFLFPVKSEFGFVTGPAGSIGMTNLEFRIFSHPTERRMTRRTEPRQR